MLHVRISVYDSAHPKTLFLCVLCIPKNGSVYPVCIPKDCLEYPQCTPSAVVPVTVHKASKLVVPKFPPPEASPFPPLACGRGRMCQRVVEYGVCTLGYTPLLHLPLPATLQHSHHSLTPTLSPLPCTSELCHYLRHYAIAPQATPAHASTPHCTP